MRFIVAIDFFLLSGNLKIVIVQNITTTQTQDGPLTGAEIANEIYSGTWLISHPGLNHTVTYSVVDATLLGQPDKTWADQGDLIGLTVVENP